MQLVRGLRTAKYDKSNETGLGIGWRRGNRGDGVGPAAHTESGTCGGSDRRIYGRSRGICDAVCGRGAERAALAGCGLRRCSRDSGMEVQGMNNQEILSREWSGEFVKLMQNRIVVSHYKYGWMSQTYPDLAQAAKCIRERLELYEKTGNTEWLVDIANFAMIEYRFPSHPQAHFRATDSRESPGLAGGISYKELMEDAGND